MLIIRTWMQHISIITNNDQYLIGKKVLKSNQLEPFILTLQSLLPEPYPPPPCVVGGEKGLIRAQE